MNWIIKPFKTKESQIKCKELQDAIKNARANNISVITYGIEISAPISDDWVYPAEIVVIDTRVGISDKDGVHWYTINDDGLAGVIENWYNRKPSSF